MTPDPALEALWKNVLDRWDEDKAHAAFLEHCRETDQLVEAAVRYRGMMGDRERGASAEKRLTGVQLLALMKLESMRTPAREAKSHAAAWVAILLFLGGSVALLAYLSVVN